MRTLALAVFVALAGCGNFENNQKEWPPGEAVTSPDGVHLHRFSVPGGWLYWVDGSYDGGFTFVPFPGGVSK